jgi:acyl carrier protein
VPACGEGLPPIGRPITNVQVYVLNEEMDPVPAGMEGELYVGGVGVARGYRNRKALTAERFVNDKSATEEVKLYRTGDLARQLPDGQLQFLGRIDDQVKIRGYRIEPAEIVAVLNSHSAVEASEVVAHPKCGVEKQLVAYVTQREGFGVTARELRDFLSERLPEFMIPVLFVEVESLPLNASGKVDRRALPTPTEANIMHEEAYVGPRTPLEQRVVQMLEELLKVNKVSIYDNFFLLGGNSLLGAQVIARVRDTFSVELSLLKLFDHPTAAELAGEIEQLVLAKVNAISEGDAQRLVTGAEAA